MMAILLHFKSCIKAFHVQGTKLGIWQYQKYTCYNPCPQSSRALTRMVGKGKKGVK